MKKKKQIRLKFKNDCLERDNHKCKCCGETEGLTVHHIIDRNEIINGGYVKENGITVCEECHLLAEEYHISGNVKAAENFHPDDLFKLIGSNRELAIRKSELL